MNVLYTPRSRSTPPDGQAPPATVRVGDLHLPTTALFAEGVDPGDSLVGRTVLSIAGSMPPLLLEDVMFLSFQEVALTVVAASPRSGKRIDRAVVGAPVYEALSALATIGAPVLRAEGLDAEALQQTHTLCTGGLERALTETCPDPAKARLALDVISADVGSALTEWSGRYTRWRTARWSPAQTREGRAEPALAVLFEVDSAAVSRVLGPACIGRARAEAELLRQIRTKGCLWLLREQGEDGRPRSAGDLLLDVSLMDEGRRPGTRFRWGSDGLIHSNAKLDVDRLRNRALRRARERPGDAVDVAEGSALDPLEDAQKAEEAVIATRTERDLRRRCRERGRSSEAALVYILDRSRGRRVVALKHGVSERAMRHAEPWVMRQIEAHRRRLA